MLCENYDTIAALSPLPVIVIVIEQGVIVSIASSSKANRSALLVAVQQLVAREANAVGIGDRPGRDRRVALERPPQWP